MMSDEAKVEVMRSATDSMIAPTTPSIAAVYGIDRSGGELMGSGTFVEFHGTRYLLTAAHVVRDALARWPMVGCSATIGSPP